MKERIMRHTPPRQHGDLSPITLRIADACRTKLYELIKAGEIEVIKVGAITLVPMSGIKALLNRGRPGADEGKQSTLTEALHPFLANAILTASIAETPESVRCDLSPINAGTRTKAENSVVERMITALYDASGCAEAAA